MSFLFKVIQPHAVEMFVLMLMCLIGYGYPGYQGRSSGSFVYVLWLLGGIMALVAWIVLVFS